MLLKFWYVLHILIHFSTLYGVNSKSHPVYNPLYDELVENYYRTAIGYIGKIFCNAKFYAHFHIYIENRVASTLPERILGEINSCMCAPILLKR